MSTKLDREETAKHEGLRRKWRSFFGRDSAATDAPADQLEEDRGLPSKWSMGVLNDRTTHEVPGSILLLTGYRNEPLGLRNAPARTSTSSLPSPLPPQSRRPSSMSVLDTKKKTSDGAIVLEPQPDDSHNDPLNWPAWRRDTALFSLGFYCMVGGGMTPILAAGFTNVAETYNVTVPEVALTTGLYMMGMGVGSVFASPTAILYGKRPVYLVSCLLFIGTSIWCAAAQSYASLVVARVLQGVSVSPVECLPSATIAEIFFLHERAYRIGIYTLLLLGGKNLIPLVSAAIIESLEWRWVFWIVAIVVGFCWILLFLFVPETFWDRTPRPKDRSRKTTRLPSISSYYSRASSNQRRHVSSNDGAEDEKALRRASDSGSRRGRPPLSQHKKSRLHVGFSVHDDNQNFFSEGDKINDPEAGPQTSSSVEVSMDTTSTTPGVLGRLEMPARHEQAEHVTPAGGAPPTPALRTFNSPSYSNVQEIASDYFDRGHGRGQPGELADTDAHHRDQEKNLDTDPERTLDRVDDNLKPRAKMPAYTSNLKEAPKRTFIQQLRPFEGRLHHDNWFRVAFRPFILFAYPAVLWSAVVYSCSVGWLIVLSESVAVIYRSQDTYNFSALSTGLIYLSPFIGGILGTAVAGKLSDIIVQAMARRNGGIYEPEFRLVMAAPVALTTVIGLMGFGWSAQEHDHWIVPTIFFGTISFGCSLGSTTAITFCVDSYRQYAGEALVTLNFSKNIFHGLVFSLFFNSWLEKDGSRDVFIALGGIQLALLCLTVPMYIYGKRARMWTVRKNLMEIF